MIFSLTLSPLHQLTVDVVEVAPEKGVIGKQFRKEAKVIMEALAAFTSSQAGSAEKEAADKG